MLCVVPRHRVPPLKRKTAHTRGLARRCEGEVKRRRVSLIGVMRRPSPGAGNVVNDVQLVYNPFGQLVADYQQHGGSVNAATTPSVGYTYADGSAGTVRRTGVVYPNGRVVGYQYASGGDDAFNRVTAIVDGGSARRSRWPNMPAWA